MTDARILRSSTAIEPLESRIAPALLVNGANLLGAGGPSTGETSVGDHASLVVKVSAGQAIVWFDGENITGISVGPGVKMDVYGGVGILVQKLDGTLEFERGDIVANLTKDGHLTDSDNDPTNGEDGGVLLANDILGINLHKASGFGGARNIVTGGSVSNVTVEGQLNGIYAGDSVFRTESTLGGGGTATASLSINGPGIDINPVTPGLQADFVFHKTGSSFKAGASIANVSVEQGENLQIFSGSGSPTGTVVAGTAVAGGSISNVSINLAKVVTNSPVGTPSYYILAGDGGDGKTAGAGGSISNLLEKKSSGIAIVHGGNGGFGNGGAGGAGGSIVGYDAQSASGNYDVKSGNGGQGTPGGAGGRIMNANFANNTPVAGVLLTADFNKDGYDDVLVADSGTGNMVLNINLAGGGYMALPQNGSDAIIPAAGVGPVDAVATDADGDGKLDAVVLYGDGTMAAFINQGGGLFYKASDAKFASFGVSLGYSPSKFTQLSPGSSIYAVAENADGKGTLHGLSFGVESTGAKLDAFPITIKYSRPIADVEQSYVGLVDGAIQKFQFAFKDNQKGLVATDAFPTTILTTGGLDDLEIDASGTRLLALSSIGKQVGIYDISGTKGVGREVVSLSDLEGKPTSVKFINDGDPNTADDFVVLSNSVDGSQFTLVAAPPESTPLAPYTEATQFSSKTIFRNFEIVKNKDSAPSIAAIAGPLDKFTEIQDFVSTQDFALPFASKQLTLVTGKGGTGLDVGTKLGKGGAGGSFVNVNAVAQTITLIAGNGGDSNNGAAGAGGSITNAVTATASKVNGVTKITPGSFKAVGGDSVVPVLAASAALDLNLGNGGTPQGSGGKSASGGAGGDLAGITILQSAGDVHLTTGKGGDGKGGNGGKGGSVNRLDVTAGNGGLNLITGAGGLATALGGNGGAGGSINNVDFTLSLDGEVEALEESYTVAISTGLGGAAANGLGGAGGDITNSTLELDPSNITIPDNNAIPPIIDPHRDSTVYTNITAGDAGAGSKGGGIGGNIRAVDVTILFDEIIGNTLYENPAAVQMQAGRGGDSSTGNGGAGGVIALAKPISGVTGFDLDSSPTAFAALQLIGGAGGNGGAAGGAGGGVSGLIAQNAAAHGDGTFSRTQLTGAYLEAGKGGEGGTGVGGAGGTVTNNLIGVNGGILFAFGGLGGGSVNAKGGAGGAVTNSEFGLVASGAPIGMQIEGGTGGVGKLGGGAGGMLSGLRLNTPESTNSISAVLLGGHGGAATSALGVGGKGGDIANITQAKDYNSSINLVEAGNGGDNALGKGGAGGNVLNIKTVGFFGRPSNFQGDQLGVFDGSEPQGVFSGRGGDGATDGVNGSISGVIARQIAAMGAAMDTATHLFAVASKISNVTAAVIGFDHDFDGVFDTQGAPGASPSSVVPVDGFILAAALSKVTGARQAFTFLS